MFKKYGKSLLQLAGAIVLGVIFVVQEATKDGSVISGNEWVLVAIAAVGAFQVWGAANIPGFEKAKTLMSAVTAVLALAATLVTDGIQGQEWMALIVLALTTLGVATAPARSESAPVVDSTFTERPYRSGLV